MLRRGGAGTVAPGVLGFGRPAPVTVTRDMATTRSEQNDRLPAPSDGADIRPSYMLVYPLQSAGEALRRTFS